MDFRIMHDHSYLWACDATQADADMARADPFLRELRRWIPGAVDGWLTRVSEFAVLSSIVWDGAGLGGCSPSPCNKFVFRLSDASHQIAVSSTPLAIADWASGYDAIVCVNDVASSSRLGGPAPSLALQLAYAARTPLWIAPRHFVGVNRIVLADAGEPSRCAQQLRYIAAWLADGFQMPLLVAHANPRGMPGVGNGWLTKGRTPRNVASVEFPSLPKLAAALRQDDLLLIGGYGRLAVTRWFLGSHTESLLEAAPGAVFLLPSTCVPENNSRGLFPTAALSSTGIPDARMAGQRKA
jgi:hypothetical protein